MTSLVLQMFHHWMSLWNMSMKVTSRGSYYKRAHIFSMHLHKQCYHLETNENNSLQCDITAETNTVVKNLPKDLCSTAARVVNVLKAGSVIQQPLRARLWKGQSPPGASSAHRGTMDVRERRLFELYSQVEMFCMSHILLWHVFLMLRYASKITSSGKYNIPFEWYEYETTKALIDISF